LLASGGYDGTARLWDVPSGRERATLTDDLARLALWKPGRPVWWGTFSPDGALLATSFGGGTARLWDVPSGQRRATLNDVPQTSWLGWGTFSPDGALLAIGVGDGTARLWDVRTGRERATLTGHTRAVSWVAFSPDGALLATTSEDGTARLWVIT
jgi:WD40 repeat protein